MFKVDGDWGECDDTLIKTIFAPIPVLNKKLASKQRAKKEKELEKNKLQSNPKEPLQKIKRSKKLDPKDLDVSPNKKSKLERGNTFSKTIPKSNNNVLKKDEAQKLKIIKKKNEEPALPLLTNDNSAEAVVENQKDSSRKRSRNKYKHLLGLSKEEKLKFLLSGKLSKEFSNVDKNEAGQGNNDFKSKDNVTKNSSQNKKTKKKKTNKDLKISVNNEERNQAKVASFNKKCRQDNPSQNLDDSTAKFSKKSNGKQIIKESFIKDKSNISGNVAKKSRKDKSCGKNPEKTYITAELHSTPGINVAKRSRVKGKPVEPHSSDDSGGEESFKDVDDSDDDHFPVQDDEDLSSSNQGENGLEDSLQHGKLSSTKKLSFRDKMAQRLEAGRFRFINEQLYTCRGEEAFEMFEINPESYTIYHDGFKAQMKKWPCNPLDKIIEYIKEKPRHFIVADFGCGDAKLAQTVDNKVHSFDLVALNSHVTICEMSHIPLKNGSVDIAVFCLSLMGTNANEYLVEAFRVLRNGGVLKIAEVVSRFYNIDRFCNDIEAYGFLTTAQDRNSKMFVSLDFTKTGKQKKVLPEIRLKPCLYKKR